MGEMQTHDIVGLINFIFLILVVLFNLKDNHRIWLVSIMLCIKAISLIGKHYLPENLYVFQLFYSLSDAVMIWAVYFRFPICRWIFAKTEGLRDRQNATLSLNRFTFIRRIKGIFSRLAVNGRVIGILEDRSITRQELGICFIISVSIVVNVVLVIEHSLRHPEFFGFTKYDKISEHLMYVYNSYPDIKMGLLALVTFALFTMTVDGWVSRKLKARKSSKFF